MMRSIQPSYVISDGHRENKLPRFSALFIFPDNLPDKTFIGNIAGIDICIEHIFFKDNFIKPQ